tara:strand:+ start:141 stop:1430 length:1290 start_codon:yes stop_codon:yes gene_type:complete
MFSHQIGYLMNERAIFLILVLFLSSLSGCISENKSDELNPLLKQDQQNENKSGCGENTSNLSMAKINSTLSHAEEKISSAMLNYPNYPFGAFENEISYQVTNDEYWTSGFFPAELWIMASITSNPSLINASRNWTEEILETSYYPHSHDLWFMKGLPLSIAIGVETDDAMKDRYRHGINEAANALVTRWNSSIGAIQSGNYSGDFVVIIDSAPNQLLLLSPYLTNDTKSNVSQYGLDHLNFLQNHFIRPNGSTIHRMKFNPETGEPIGIIPGQGLNSESTWSRGQAWAVLGFSKAYALTGNDSFLESAKITADYFIENVPSGCISTWDLDLFQVSNDIPLDTSASAIFSYGLLVLAESETDPIKSSFYKEYATLTIEALVRNHLSNGSSNPGILLDQTYNVNADSRTGSYVWGDVYFLLSLQHLRNLSA